MPSQATILIVPGWQNSGPGHWQTLWQRKHPEFMRVEQRDWERPMRAEWVATLDAAVASVGGPVALVAHSLGCITVAHWAAQAPETARAVAGALLVAPPDITRTDNIPADAGFAPAPQTPLPFRSILVASENDPYCDYEDSRRLAAAWGSQFVSLGAAGHINTDAGYGPWPAGEALLASLL